LISTVSNWVSVAAGPLKDQSRIGQVEAGNRLSGVLDYFADSRLQNLEHLLRRGVEELPSKIDPVDSFRRESLVQLRLNRDGIVGEVERVNIETERHRSVPELGCSVGTVHRHLQAPDEQR